MRRVAVTMFIAGGCTAMLGVVITARTTPARWTQGLCGAGFVLCGLILLAAPPRRSAIHLSVVGSIAMLGVLIAGSNPTGMAALFYLWPMVYAAYFCSQRFAAGLMGWSAATLVAGLVVNEHHPLKVDTFVGTISSVGLMTALVSTMTRREERLRLELAAVARTDPLTGLLNRRAFDAELAVMLDRAASYGEPLALVLFDLDHFKQYNDRHGHLAGDDALRAMAAVLSDEASDGDALGRFGGEEFTVALAGSHLRTARSYADRVASRLDALTTSAGISVATRGATADALFARADEALYAAKEAGRARVAWFDGALVRTSPCDGTGRTNSVTA